MSRACGGCGAADGGAGAGGSCSRCKKVWYCGPKCHRAAWGAHRAQCARATEAPAPRGVAVAAPAAGGGGVAGARGEACGDGGARNTKYQVPNIAGDAVAVRRSLAQLGSPAEADQTAGLGGLWAAFRQARVGGDGRAAAEFDALVAAVGGVPILVRAMKAPVGRANAALLVMIVCRYSRTCVLFVVAYLRFCVCVCVFCWAWGAPASILSPGQRWIALPHEARVCSPKCRSILLCKFGNSVQHGGLQRRRGGRARGCGRRAASGGHAGAPGG